MENKTQKSNIYILKNTTINEFLKSFLGSNADYDGTFIWVLKKNNSKDWNVICEKRLSHY